VKFIILNTDYGGFLTWLYARHPGLEAQPYEEQMRVRTESLFGVADFYSSNLRKLGHQAYDIHANNEFMQKAWAREHDIHIGERTAPQQKARAFLERARRKAARTPLRHFKPLFRPVLRSLDGQPSWFYDILAAQIKHHNPDVLLNQDMAGISPRFLKEIKTQKRLLIGQHAATRLSDAEDFGCYDLVISSFPPTIEYFRQKGITAELNRMGFEPRVLSHLKDEERTLEVTFIGSFYEVHSSRVALLEAICARIPQVRIWGPGVDHLSRSSPIRGHYMGQMWGLEMLQTLRRSQITLNHHGDVAPYANNMRLFEATGVGTLLITDWKSNLQEMFEPDKEVAAYRTIKECVEMVKYYLENHGERQAIALAGQQRTLREHTYYQRMEELVEIVGKYL